MKIMTRDFGEIAVEEQDLITFAAPIFGFEHLTKFAVLMDDTLDGEFVWLQSAEDSSVCFVLASPAKLIPGYAPQLSDEVKQTLGEGTYELWNVMVVAEDFKASTVNLKSPVVFNLSSNTAMQTILEDSFPIRHPLFQAEKEGAVC